MLDEFYIWKTTLINNGIRKKHQTTSCRISATHEEFKDKEKIVASCWSFDCFANNKEVSLDGLSKTLSQAYRENPSK